jgi:hypothetical protein
MVPATLDDVRKLALSLPRSYEAVVGGGVKFRLVNRLLSCDRRDA